MLRKIIVVAFVALAGFVLADPAAAANWPSRRLDSAAWAVAGQPGTGLVRGNWGDWVHLGDEVELRFQLRHRLHAPRGSRSSTSTRAHCETLHALFEARSSSRRVTTARSRCTCSPTRRCTSGASGMRVSPTARRYRSCPVSPPTTSASRTRSLRRRSSATRRPSSGASTARPLPREGAGAEGRAGQHREPVPGRAGRLRARLAPRRAGPVPGDVLTSAVAVR